EARPHHASVFDHAFFDEDLERSAGDGASERVAAESTAVLARFQHAEDLVVREHRRYRIEAARKRLTDQGKIGLDPFMLFGEQPAGAAEPSLNLVENQNHVVARTNFADRFEITGRRNYHPRLALDGLDQEG